MSDVFDVQDAGVALGQGRHRLLALRSVSLRIAPGERVALVGANGSGKSTLLRLLHGLARPTSGRVCRPAGLRVAMLFQRPHLLRLSVQTNVTLGLWLAGLPWRQAQSRAREALARAELSHLARRNATTLSGGQQQRVALARAWALAPGALLLDEPTASLDPRAKREVETLIADLARTSPDTTLVFASHNLGQVKRLATRVVYLEQGRVLADLPVGQFFDASLMAREYPAADVFLKGEFL
jgi:tungstate transport system ATP-binding protein